MSDCRLVRKTLSTAETTGRDTAPTSASVRQHLADCRDCSQFAERLNIARSILSTPASEHVPGPEFAVNVLARLPKPTEILGRTALRLLPVTCALVLVLAGWALATTPTPADLFAQAEQASTDELAEWVNWSAEDLATPEGSDDRP